MPEEINTDKQENAHTSETLKESLLMARNKKIVQNICVWILNDIVIPLLRANFYCTEKHSEGSKIFYYRYYFNINALKVEFNYGKK